VGRIPNDVPMTDAQIAALAATPKALAHLIVEATEERLDALEPGGWSARTTLAHFRDDEYLCMRVALERMLAEESPELRFIDGGEWAPNRRRNRDRKEQLLSDFALHRQASLNILQSLEGGDWDRTGTAPGHGTFTIARFLHAWAAHDAEHIAQLQRLLGETASEAQARRARPPQ
jgi:DinB superfamily